MKGFKKFFKEDEDVQKTLAKIPKAHKNLVKGFKFLFEPHNTLQGDDGHVGMITNQGSKRIIVASPWRFGREFTLLHEIAHLIWNSLVVASKKEEWKNILKKHKDLSNEKNQEESFCMAYANYYSQRPLAIYNITSWMSFIKKLSQ